MASPPSSPPSSLLLDLAVLDEVVREAVHAVGGGEDAFHVGEDVVGGECDELAPTPKHLAEQVVRIEPVGEVGDEPYHRSVGVGTMFVEAEHDRRARREVGKARTEEPIRKVPSTPPA